MRLPRPRTLGGWLVAVMLSALLASQALAFIALLAERRFVAAAAHRDETFRRVASAVDVLMAQPEQAGVRTEAVLGSRTFRLAVAPQAQVGLRALDDNGTRALAAMLGRPAMSDVRVTGVPPGVGIMGRPAPPAAGPAAPPWASSDLVIGETEASLLWVSVRLGPGRWLNVSAIPPPAPALGLALLVPALLSSLAMALAAWWAARRLTRPLQGLTRAAETMGKGTAFAPAPEDGPEDLRRVAREFNAMAGRVKSVLDEQQMLLRAVGHDLRTPLSSLRIRLEFVADAELRQKMVETVAEMEQLTSQTLDAARGGAVDEPPRRIDLAALVAAICDDAAEMGKRVTLGPMAAVDVDGRLSELRRAIQNLVDNAVLHGGGATVSVSRDRDRALVRVEDDGPGIPEGDLKRVTEPFVRLDASRTAAVPGHGLGLTIAAAVARRHAGALTLENRHRGGLGATLRLPVANGGAAA